jgi:hypothetical protein
LLRAAYNGIVSVLNTGGTTTTTGTGSSPTGGTVPQWGQCGGQGWTGGTVCVSPFKCTFMNDFVRPSFAVGPIFC